jgi:DNA-binding NarL/FixJ family response regulator
VSTGAIRVMIVDDHDDLAGSLVILLNTEPGMACVGTLDACDHLLDAVERGTPDVVLLDMTMPGRDPLDAMAEVLERHPRCRFVVYSGYDDPSDIDRVIDRGAWGFVSKNAEPASLVTAIRRAAAGEIHRPGPNSSSGSG